MAKMHGKSGSVTCTNVTAGMLEWTLDDTCDTADVTDFSDAGVRAFLAGCTQWQGSFSGNFDNANTAKSGDSVIISLVPGTSLSFGGSAIITGRNVKTGIDGAVTMAYTFQGTGALSEDLSA